jgi:hypothetical protein
MKTLQDFLDACKTTTSVDIYDLFYDAEDTLRDTVYAEAESLGVDFAATPEPTRATMIALGEHYGIQSLIDY